jgi:pimeloyl-ACP methyl ester carboxylesterase
MPLQSGLQGHDLMRVLYLHGFASSPQSSKAKFFAEKLAERGMAFDAPDLNAPDFSTLTVSRMLSQAGDLIGAHADAVAVVGSSLGGFVAVQVALGHPTRVQRVVLLAPALVFHPATGSRPGREPSREEGHRLNDLGDRDLAAWRSSNSLEVFHYGYGRMMSVHYDLYTDAARYNAIDANLTQPVQVFQGRRDTAVDPATVERWARARPNVELHMVDDDHQLHASLDYIWREMDRFLHQQIP